MIRIESQRRQRPLLRLVHQSAEGEHDDFNLRPLFFQGRDVANAKLIAEQHIKQDNLRGRLSGQCDGFVRMLHGGQREEAGITRQEALNGGQKDITVVDQEQPDGTVCGRLRRVGHRAPNPWLEMSARR